MVNTELINSIYNKKLEIHYDEWYIRDKNNKPLKLELQGKIKCPLVNTSISSLVCSKIMDRETWPRAIDETACKKCDCYINISIRKFQEQKDKNGPRTTTTTTTNPTTTSTTTTTR